MSIVSSPTNELTVSTKSREVQRGMLAESRGDHRAIVRHFLAAAHLELVLSDDYLESGESDLSLRSLIGAASCFWRAGNPERARSILADVASRGPDERIAAAEALADLESTGTAAP